MITVLYSIPILKAYPLVMYSRHPNQTCMLPSLISKFNYYKGHIFVNPFSHH